MRRQLPFALALAAVGACSFPDANFSADDGSAPNDSGGIDHSASSSSGGNEASSSSSGGSDALADRGSTDSASDVTSSDTSSSSSGSGSSSGACDMDGDGYKAKGGTCMGNDCCDIDANAHPNVTAFFTSRDLCQSFDYNCDTMETPEWGLFSCSVGVGCTATPGFISGPPACGISQPWTSMCQYMVTTCSAGATSNVTQACN